MALLRFDALENVALSRDPFDFLHVPGFVTPERLPELCGDFPKLTRLGSFPLDGLKYGPAFGQLVADLTGPEMTRILSAKFDLDLSPLPTLITVRGQVGARDGFIHTDSETKVITLLLYLNETWDGQAGRLRLLRGPSDLDDYVQEIDPAGGNLLVFRRSGNSYHGHYPAAGSRQTLQLNWMVDLATRNREWQRHRRSAWLKRFGL